MQARKLALISFIALSSILAAAGERPKEFRNWPAGASPQEIGQRVTGRFLNTPHLLSQDQNKAPYIAYPESVTWYGALTFTKLGREKELGTRLIERFEPLL